MMRKVFTTGQISKICNVASRTVSKWVDSGRLKGYRIPGSNDRRVPREALVKFLKDYGMPPLEDRIVLLIGLDQHLRERIHKLLSEEVIILEADSVFVAGGIFAQRKPNAVVLDAAMGSETVRSIVRAGTLLIILSNEDERGGQMEEEEGILKFQKPLDPTRLVEALAEAV